MPSDRMYETLYAIKGKEERTGIIYQIITADGITKRKNSPIPWNISIETGTRVFAQAEEYFTYNKRKITFNHFEMLIANAPPTFSSPDLNTKNQHRGICKRRVTTEFRSIGMVKL